MKKAHFHAQISQQIKQRYTLLTALGLGLLAAVDYSQAEFLNALLTAGFVVLLLTYWAYLSWPRTPSATIVGEYVFIVLLMALTLLTIVYERPLVHWSYFIPIYCYFLLPWRAANYMLPVYSVLTVVLVFMHFAGELRLQIIFGYLACYGFAFLYALINQRNNSSLESIINSDPISRIYNQAQLQEDLNKEILRADRQRSALILLIITVPQEWKTLKREKLEHLLANFGQSLRHNLRGFDTCYRLDSDDFVIVLPQTSLALGEKIQQELQENIAHFAQQPPRPQLHLEQYRPEDDLHSLMARIDNEVTHAH